MTICILFSILTIAIIVLGGFYLYTASKQLLKKYLKDSSNKMDNQIDNDPVKPVPKQAEPKEPQLLSTSSSSSCTTSNDKVLTISLIAYDKALPHCNIVISENGIADGNQDIQQSISLKNVNLLVKQNQQIIKENFEHTNFIDCIHIVCNNKMLLTIVIQRTENVDTLEQAYVHINKSIETHLNVEMGNVIVILDGLLNIKQTIGEKIIFTKSSRDEQIQFDTTLQASHLILTATAITKEDGDNVSIIATDTMYGFDDHNSNTKFRQTIKDEYPKKYINHFKNILFP